MNKFLPFIFFVLCSCQFQAGQSGSAVLSSNINILVTPYGRGNAVVSSRPIIFLEGGKNEVCRQYPFTTREARNVLEKESVDPDFLDDFFDIDEDEDEGGSTTTDPQNTAEELKKPVRIDVEDNWLKFGLWISNTNRGDNNFFLIVDSITFNAVAFYRNEKYEHNGTVTPGDCAGEDESPPFLYFVPPQEKVEYNPFSENPFHNLIIYLSGFPIIDNSESTDRIGGNRQSTASLSSGISSITSQSQPATPYYNPETEIIQIPVYTVELILRGYFMTKSGARVASFVKRARFLTQSSL